jgi:hypothetical protein
MDGCGDAGRCRSDRGDRGPPSRNIPKHICPSSRILLLISKRGSGNPSRRFRPLPPPGVHEGRRCSPLHLNANLSVAILAQLWSIAPDGARLAVPFAPRRVARSQRQRWCRHETTCSHPFQEQSEEQDRATNPFSGAECPVHRIGAQGLLTARA